MSRLLSLISCGLILSFLALIPSSISADDWSDPALVNNIISEVQTPLISPGGTGDISFVLTNPFSVSMTNITIRAEPYLLVFATGESDWENITDPPIFSNSSSPDGSIRMSVLDHEDTNLIEWQISTTRDTSRGGSFSQSVYFVRILLTFSVEGENISYASRGYFSDDQWERLRNGSAINSIGGIDSDYLDTLGHDAIIPEISFIVRDEIPLWPLGLLIIASAVSVMVGLYYHLKKYPSTAPRLSRILTDTRNAFVEMSNRLKKRPGGKS